MCWLLYLFFIFILFTSSYIFYSAALRIKKFVAFFFIYLPFLELINHHWVLKLIASNLVLCLLHCVEINEKIYTFVMKLLG